MVEIMKPIATEIVRAIVGIARERIQKSSVGENRDPQSTIAPEKLEGHLQEVVAWSDTIQFYGMSTGAATDQATVPLTTSTPRRFRSRGRKESLADENSLVSSATRHCLLLGDPGAGKTTTLKRLARRILLTAPSNSEGDTFQYPVVLRLRELTTSQSIHGAIATALGIQAGAVASNSKVPSEGEYFERQVSGALNDSKAIVMLDGLDEVALSARSSVDEEIIRLGRRLSDAKLVLTCRSGEHLAEFEGFTVAELCPLEPGQIADIADRWLPGRGQEFIAALRDLPYFDLTDRPLLLTQLIVVFERYGLLPEQPSQVYRWVVNLLLEDWDRHRRISRASKYGHFTPDRKADFLAALAYRLTYKIKTKSFTTSELLDAYRDIHSRFNLPSEEAPDVVNEIQTHAGLIVAAGLGYEFSHLSLQEYLCASHLVREPFPENLDGYMASYPAPLAVAVALSSNPSAWFSGLVLSSRNQLRLHPGGMSALLARLAVERPRFDPSVELGIAVLRVASECRGSQLSPDILLRAFTGKVLAAALTEGVGYYRAVARGHGNRRIRLKLQRRIHNRFAFEAPPAVSLDEDLVKFFISDLSIPIGSVDLEGRPFVPTKIDEIDALPEES
jgi:hypothetical protein